MSAEPVLAEDDVRVVLSRALMAAKGNEKAFAVIHDEDDNFAVYITKMGTAEAVGMLEIAKAVVLSGTLE